MAVAELRLRKQGGIWRRQRWTQFVELARNIVAPTDGVWVHVEGIHPFTLVLSGDFVGVANILAANQDDGDQPDDADNDYPVLGVPFTKLGSMYVDAPYNWLKCQVPTVSRGTIRRVLFFGVERPGT